MLLQCPQNLYVEDGTSCAGNNGNASCYHGVCLTRDTQCQEVWGEGRFYHGHLTTMLLVCHDFDVACLLNLLLCRYQSPRTLHIIIDSTHVFVT